MADLIDLEIYKDNPSILVDTFDFLAGSYIGRGISRKVYEYNLNSDYVIKFDIGSGFDNITEWDVWWNISTLYPKLARFLAPCISISPGGRLLIQEKTLPLPNKRKLPKKIPAFLADTKIQNWGLLNNKVVCHDYSNHKLYTNMNKRLISPHFWSDSYQKIMNS